ncbi:MAG: gliding motility-associated C-terminal domain-containing protein [Saprospiraceae bacterium]|nr:gliding motility-associated C-terminal domain-containing protein [Saprospiraceae bacterium]
MRVSLLALFLGLLFLTLELKAQVSIYGPVEVCGGCHTYSVDNQSSQILTGWELNYNGISYFKDTINPLVICFDSLDYGLYTLTATTVNGSVGQMQIYYSAPQPIFLFSFGGTYCPNSGGNCEQVCAGTEVTYSVEVPSQTPITYSVSGGTIVQQNGNDVTILWSQPGQGFLEAFSSDPCYFPAAICIEILSVPDAIIGVDGQLAPDTLDVCAGQDVAFEDFSQPAAKTQWALSDGRLSQEKNPLISFDSPGDYIVQLVASSGCDCADTASMVVRVRPVAVPDLDCIGTVCPGEHVTYTTAPGCSYTWTVSPEGTVLSGGGAGDAEVTIEWNNGPEGVITLLATGCGAVCAEPAKIRIPVLDGTADIKGPASVCKGSEATYSIVPYHGTDYTWEVSPGAILVSGQGSNQILVEWPNKNSINSGWVKVDYENCSQGCSGSAQKNIVLTTPFYIDGPLKGCPDASILFKAKKGLLPVNCNWKVVDQQGMVVKTGVGMTGQFTYDAIHGSGSYTVIASQPNPNLTCNAEYRWGFRILDPLPLVDSITGPQLICPGDAYTYVGHSTQTQYNLIWTIANGGQVSETVLDQTVVTWAASGGPYQLELRHQLRSEPGCLSDPIAVTVLPFTTGAINDDPEVCLGEIQEYVISPDLPELSVSWSIQPQDAGVIRESTIAGRTEVQWLQPGNATLQAEVCGVQVLLPVVVHDLPQPNIIHPTGVCLGSQATVSTTQAYTSYVWYNDGSGVVSTNATADLDPDTWLLGVEDNYSCRDTVSFTMIEWPLPEITLSSPDPHGFCPANGETPPTLYTLIDDVGYQLSWYLDDTYILWAKGQTATGSQFGFYHVVATDQNGCTNTSNKVEVFEYCDGNGGMCTGSCSGVGAPCPEMTLNIIPGSYCNERSYSATSSGPAMANGFWKVYDINLPGPVQINQDIINYTYPKAGYYTLYFGADLGGKFCDAAFIDTIPVSADFFASAVCEGQVMSFTDRSTYLPKFSITDWSWDFGDPASGAANSSLVKHPDHAFSSAGTYTVTLTITSSTGCDSRITRQVVVRPAPSLSINGPAMVCEETGTEWYGGSPDQIVDWSWNFDDPSSGTSNQVDLVEALHMFNTPGALLVKLTATDEFGCTNTINHPIQVNANTLAGMIQYNSPLCEGDATTLHFDGSGDQFIWSHGAMGNDPVVKEAGAYALTVTDNLGCRFEAIPAIVEILPEPAGLIRATEKNDYGVISAIHYDYFQTCYGEPVFLSLELQTNYNVVWSNLSTDKAQEFSEERGNALPVGTHVFHVTLTDPATGCTSQIGPMTMEVKPLPVKPQIAYDGSAPFCAFTGEVMRVQNIKPGMTYTWSTQQNGTFIQVQSAGVYSVQAIDLFGCKAESNALTLNESPSTLLAPDGCHRGCKPDTLCIGTPSWLQSWQWVLDGSPLPPPDGQAAYLPIQQSGSYSLQLVHQNGCAATSDPFSMELFDGISQFGGNVWFDVNNNGIIDGPDTLVSNIKVQLWDPNGVPDETLTVPGGGYTFPDVPGLGEFVLHVDESSLPPFWTAVWQDSLLSVNSCDQVLTTDILLQFACQTITKTVTLKVCPGETVTYLGDVLSEGDTQAYSYQTVQGCDSMVNVTVVAHPDFAWQVTVDSTCVGQSTGSVGIIPVSGNVSPLEFSLDGILWQSDPQFKDLSSGMVTLFLRDTNLCAKQVNVTVPDRPAVPDHTWSIEVDTSCVGQPLGALEVIPDGSSTAPVLFSLDGSVWQSDPYFPGLLPGSLTVYLRDSQDCQRPVNAVIPVWPTLDFTLPQLSLPCEGDGVVLAPNWLSGEKTVLSWTWNTGLSDSMLIVDQPGVVSLSVDGICGTVTRSVTVDYAPEVTKPDRFFFVPSVFSPDQNGINDIFRPLQANGLNVTAFHFEVFDRWGNKMYETDDPLAGWDGWLRSEELDQEVFVWWLEATVQFCREEVHIRRQGDVTLVLGK